VDLPQGLVGILGREGTFLSPACHLYSLPAIVTLILKDWKGTRKGVAVSTASHWDVNERSNPNGGDFK
jgi:hypothetical protein